MLAIFVTAGECKVAENKRTSAVNGGNEEPYLRFGWNACIKRNDFAEVGRVSNEFVGFIKNEELDILQV